MESHFGMVPFVELVHPAFDFWPRISAGWPRSLPPEVQWAGYRAWRLSVSSRLNAQIRNRARGVVKAVREIRQADDERQFDDLPIVIVFPQFLDRPGSNRRRSARHPLGVEKCRLVLLIEQRAAVVERQRLDLLCRDANSLRRSGVGPRSIFTAVQHGCLQISQFLEAR